MDLNIKSQQLQQLCARWFWSIVSIHAILWTVVFTCVRHALAHDAIEMVMWGQHLQWGYDKNPWFNAWLARLGSLGGISGWLIYSICEFLVVLAFWATWRLGNKIFTPIYALLGALFLEAIGNYVFAPAFFNDNLILLALWPLMVLCFYNALEKQSMWAWLGVGVFSGLAMMTKYNTALLLVIMLFFLLFNTKARTSFKYRGIYLAFIVFILICLPNVIWLIQHDFISIRYLLVRSGAKSYSAWNHIIYPLRFIFAQLLKFLIPILLFLLLFLSRSRKTKIIAQPTVITKFNYHFLLAMGLAPFAFTLLFSIIFGWFLYIEWGMPLLFAWGLILFAYKQPIITKATFYRFITIIVILLLIWPLGYIVTITHTRQKHSDNYPAPEIAQAITKQWRARFHKPLKYVAGSRYIAGYVAFYSKDKPSVYVEWDRRFSPWINLQKLREYGAVFIQDGYYGTTVFEDPKGIVGGRKFPPEVLKRFPRLQVQPLQYFPWYKGRGLQPVVVLVGFLPPNPSTPL